MKTVLTFLENSSMTLYVVVFLISIYRLPLYIKTPLKYLPVILLLTLITEVLGGYIRDVYGPPNIIVFNIYYFFYFSLFYYIFLNVIEEKKFKKLIRIGVVLYWVFYLKDLIFVDIVNDSFLYSYIAGAGILVFCIILYYISILQSSLVLVVKNDLLFWVSVGLFLFYIGYLPIKMMRTWYYEINKFFEILWIIQFSLINVMYVFFLIGFLWMKKRS